MQARVSVVAAPDLVAWAFRASPESARAEKASLSDPARASASRGSAGPASRLAAAQAGPGPAMAGASEEPAWAASWKRVSLEALAYFVFCAGVTVTVGPVVGFAVKVWCWPSVGVTRIDGGFPAGAGAGARGVAPG